MKAGYKMTEVGVIPEDWDVSTLSRLAGIRGGIAKNENAAVSDPVSVHYLRVANVQDGYLNLSDMSKIQLSRKNLARYMVLPGDVLMNEGGDLDKLGRGAIWRGEFNPCVHQNHVFVVRCKENLLPDYLNVWTTTPAARRFFLLAGKQTTNLASISKFSLGELPVAVPMAEEQRAIAQALSDTDALLASLDQLIAKKQGIKQAAMQQLLTGKTRLPGFGGEWEVKRLGEIVQIQKGELITSKTLKLGNIPVIAGGKQPAYFHAEANRHGQTITISASGASAGYVALYKESIFASDCSTIGEGKDYSVQFIFYLLLSKQSEIYKAQTGGAQPHIHAKDLNPIVVNMPPLPEQTAITTVLSDMDAELALLTARRVKTRDLKQSMMQALLTGRIRLV
jgi:type I restriction enzyme, S subunit